jgi:hypothetical protein
MALLWRGREAPLVDRGQCTLRRLGVSRYQLRVAETQCNRCGKRDVQAVTDAEPAKETDPP